MSSHLYPPSYDISKYYLQWLIKVKQVRFIRKSCCKFTDTNLTRKSMYVMYNVTLKRVRATLLLLKIDKYLIIWVCVCIHAFVIRHANRIISAQHHVVTRGLFCLHYISILSHTGTVFGGGFHTHSVCSVQIRLKHSSFEEEVSEILS
jgi:hypothetical protein